MYELHTSKKINVDTLSILKKKNYTIIQSYVSICETFEIMDVKVKRFVDVIIYD